jgi:uncharacterized membrane protein (DUF485 family)
MNHSLRVRKTNSPLFQKLLSEKRRFIVPVTLFYLSFYFSLPILTSYFPKLANLRVWGYISVAWILLFAQFVMTLIVCILYVWKARRFDQLSSQIHKIIKDETANQPEDGREV